MTDKELEETRRFLWKSAGFDNPPLTVGAAMGKTKEREVTWAGSKPDDCNICQESLGEQFIDGATRGGPWAIMCDKCHKGHGAGLGTGRGQKFVKQDDGRWLKVEG